jgi:hypothetical protein
MKQKISRLIVAACIGAIVGCGIIWIVFPMPNWRGDGICDVRGCNNTRNCFFTETEDPSSPVTEEFCEFHEQELVK